MTDEVTADHIYLMPLTVASLEQILQERSVDAVLPTMGGQTALNLCIEADQQGLWGKHQVKIIGVEIDAIERTENREIFRQLMIDIGMPIATSKIANSFLEGKETAQEIGFPLVIRPSFTLGGYGGSFVHNKEELNDASGKNMSWNYCETMTTMW